MNKLLIDDAVKKLREKRPLVHCITNYVTANDCANIILALGGIPTMAQCITEVQEISSKADSLVINIGTLSDGIVDSMILAGKTANKNNVPIIFDPVGAAASNSRKESAFKILKEVRVSVIKGNMAEMKVLLGMNGSSKGVDSIEEVTSEDAKEIVKKVALKMDTIAAITGEKDYISDGSKVFVIENGVESMTRVTGTGCMTTSLIGAYLGVIKDSFLSSILGIMTMGIAGEKAYENLKEGEGSGSFRVKLIDAVDNMTGEELMKRGKINEER